MLKVDYLNVFTVHRIDSHFADPPTSGFLSQSPNNIQIGFWLAVLRWLGPYRGNKHGIWLLWMCSRFADLKRSQRRPERIDFKLFASDLFAGCG